MGEGIMMFGQILVEFNCEGQNEGNNGGIMMYNYGLDLRELDEQFLVLIDCPLMCEGKTSFELQWILIYITSQNGWGIYNIKHIYGWGGHTHARINVSI